MKDAKASVLIMVLISILMVGCAPAAKGQWEVVLQTTVERPVRMAAFLDETSGLTGGPDEVGKAHYTTDSGQTWTMADSSEI